LNSERCWNVHIYDFDSSIDILFPNSTATEELEKFITYKIVDRFTRLEGSVHPERVEMLEYCIKNKGLK
jgi:hypothetical protein